MGRIAILGLYNSGSTGLAGMLHRLGVNMGPPFYKTSEETSEENFYEPYDLSWHLRKWWDEPYAIETVRPDVRVEFLRRWVALQECQGVAFVGAKHPLLSLCGEDILTAWGQNSKLIWSYRSLADSIRGLKRRKWLKGHEETLQTRLWNALEALTSSYPQHVTKIPWDSVKSNPMSAAQTLAKEIGLQPTPEMLANAAAFVRKQ